MPWLTHPAKIDQQDLNSTHIDEFRVPYFPYPLWRDKAMHELVMHVALSAADAIAKSGRPIRMAQRVMLRVDIALTVQGRMVSSIAADTCMFSKTLSMCLRTSCWVKNPFVKFCVVHPDPVDL